MPYEVILHDIGTGKNQIIDYVQSYIHCDEAKALQILENLPMVIKKTNSKMEAYLIQEAIRSFGATVEIVQTDSVDAAEHSYNNITEVRNAEEESEFYGKGPVTMWPVHNRIRGDQEGPIKTNSGCLGIILAGFLLFVSGLIIASIVIA